MFKMLIVLAALFMLFGVGHEARLLAACRTVSTDKNHLPQLISLFRIVDGLLEPAGSLPAKSIPATLDDCGHPSYLSFKAGDNKTYLIKRSEMKLEAECTCLAQSERIAGVAGQGALKQCDKPCS